MALHPSPSGPDPLDPEVFALAAIQAICAAGTTPEDGRRIFERCRCALEAGATARMGFRHLAKAEAIDRIWAERESLVAGWARADDKTAFLRTLPWVGPLTAQRLACQLWILGVAEAPSVVEEKG